MKTECLCDSIVVAPSFLERLYEQARNALPEECCGVFGGRKSVVTSVYPLTNDLHSPEEFFANPKELFDAIRSMRKKNEDFIGIYHSHPSSDPDPSPTDAIQNHYPGKFYFILSMKNGKPFARCYIMSKEKFFSSVQIV